MKRANRILLLVTQADWGGVQSFLIKFGKQLRAEGREVLLASAGEGELWERAAEAGIPTRRLVHMTREIHPVKDLAAIPEIKQLIEEFKPDAIHLNSAKMGAVGFIAANLIPRSRRPFVVYRIGGWTFLEPLAEWKRWMYRMVEKITARYKDVIITVHPGDEKIAAQLHITPRHRLMTVANGLDVPATAAKFLPRAEAREKLGLPQHAFVFGTIANAYATKALLPYLDVFARIHAKNNNTHCVIIGDGPEFEALKRKRTELGLDESVTLTGHRDDAANFISAFDVFVLNSKKEGMPWTVLEAMCASIPCITTDVGACKWMLMHPEHSHAGIVVPKEDATALFDAMHSLLTNTEKREALARGGKPNVLERFSWDSTYRGNRDALDQTI